MYLSWLLRGVAAAASCDPGPVGVALMSGNVLQLAANGFLFDLYLKAFALTSDESGDYFIALSQTIISAGTAFISAGQSSSGIDVVSGGTLVVLSGGIALETTVGGGLEIVSSDIRRRTGRVRHRRRRHRLRRIASDRRRRHREQRHDCERRHARRLRRRLG